MTFWIICAVILIASGIGLNHLGKRLVLPPPNFRDGESEALALLRDTRDRKLFLATALEWDLGSEERANIIAARLPQFQWDLGDEERLDELFVDAPEGPLKNALARELSILIVARARTGSYEKLVSAFLVRSEELIILLHAGAKIERHYRNDRKMHVVQARLQESFIGQMGPREYLSIARYLNVAA